MLLVTATQQKYRSARVADELAAAARGAHLVFVQTHADQDADIRDDWRQVMETASGKWPVERTVQTASSRPLGEGQGCAADSPNGTRQPLALSNISNYLPKGEGTTSRIFRIDSLRALADAQAGLQPRGEFADLLDLLTRQMAGAAGNRIRRANFLDLVADTLDACRRRIERRCRPSANCNRPSTSSAACWRRQIAGEMQTELLANRRQWENRLLAQTASRWGFSPFALVLRVYQGIGGLLAGRFAVSGPHAGASGPLGRAAKAMRTWRRQRQDRSAPIGASIARPPAAGTPPNCARPP